ncbi:MAG: DUF1127 domain-containing protein [Rhodobacteraceae bacterium]|nr:DUF1127 domain-containing protein [Paracoccaceae bacterium]
MATFETTRPAPFGAVTTYRVLSAIDALRVALIDWKNTRQTYAALSRLSDRELNDIGLSRADIERF